MTSSEHLEEYSNDRVAYYDSSAILADRPWVDR